MFQLYLADCVSRGSGVFCCDFNLHVSTISSGYIITIVYVYATVCDSPLVYQPLFASAKDVLPIKIAFMEPGHYNAVVSTLSTSAMTHRLSLRRSLSATQLNC